MQKQRKGRQDEWLTSHCACFQTAVHYVQLFKTITLLQVLYYLLHTMQHRVRVVNEHLWWVPQKPGNVCIQ
jgi:hypothetical protein